MDLLKLEKLEIGGVRGRALSQLVQLLHQEFVDTYKVFTERPYDCLDLNNKVEYHDHRGARCCPHPLWGNVKGQLIFTGLL